MKKMYKINQFTEEQFDQFEEYGWCDDEIVIIEKKDAYCMDITANGKRIVPILRKIEESLTKAGLAGDNGIFAGWFGEWANELTDRSSKKYFIWNYSGKSDRERGCWSYSWGIEQIDDDLWYIFLNIAKPQQETEEAQDTTTTENTESENMDDSMNWDYVESELWKRHEKMTKREENTMKYDNCKGCGNIHCEHYGKDREFVCPNGISCKTEKIKNTKTYIIKCAQFHIDEDFNMIGNPIIREFSGLSLGEAKAAWMMARANNDMTKYSPLNVCDIIIPEEE